MNVPIAVSVDWKKLKTTSYGDFSNSNKSFFSKSHQFLIQFCVILLTSISLDNFLTEAV